MREKYLFNDFEWCASGPALYHKGELIQGAGRRALQVLGVFVRRPNQLVSHQEVLDAVWGADNVSVTQDNVHQAISQLRKVFRSQGPQDPFKSKKGIGYTFVAEVTTDSGTHAELAPAPAAVTLSPPRPARRKRWPWAALALGVAAVTLVFSLSLRGDPAESDIRRLVHESQLYETLVLYEDPSSFKEDDLEKYWTADVDVNSNSDRSRIRKAVQKLASEGTHYGPESKCERFEFEWVKINGSKDFADVRTLEKWSVAIYDGSGQLVRNRTIGPYFVDYNVRKAEGRWLIERSNTGRTIRPRPQNLSLVAVEAPTAGTPFAVKILGEDLQPDAAYIEVRGPGCPDTNPCVVPNTTLRETASITTTSIDNVRLHLNSGTFQIVIRNGDSPPSDSLELIVP